MTWTSVKLTRNINDSSLNGNSAAFSSFSFVQPRLKLVSDVAGYFAAKPNEMLISTSHSSEKSRWKSLSASKTWGTVPGKSRWLTRLDLGTERIIDHD